MEKDGVPARFFLNGTTCAGILDRALRRGKDLPSVLKKALEAVRDNTVMLMHNAETQMYRFHAAYSIAMTGNGNAESAAPADTARCLDTTGGYSQNQGGNLVLQAQSAAEIQEDAPLFFDLNQVTSVLNYSSPAPGDPVHPLTRYGLPPHVAFPETAADAEGVYRLRIRRLTPLECTRMQGFPDDYFTDVRMRGRPLSDKAVYNMTGNSWAVPVIQWIFCRLHSENRGLCNGTGV